MRKRLRVNTPERLFEDLARRNGWRTTKRGWPDFLCFNQSTGEIIAVEVKPRLDDGRRLQLLKRDQGECMAALAAHGIRCFVSDGVTLEPFRREVHASEEIRKQSAISRIARMSK